METTENQTFFEKYFSINFGFENEKLEMFLNKCIGVLLIIVIVLILFKIIDLITKLIKKRMLKKKLDKTLSNIIIYLTNKIIKILLILVAIGCLGIDTSSIVGLFTATGLGIGLAVQGALANFAGGMLILFTRPFRVDDYISAQDVEGTVEDIHMFYTYLRTPDNKLIMVPNGTLIAGVVVNYSAKPKRRLDILVSIDHEANFMEVEKIIIEVMKSHALVLKDPTPTARIAEWTDSSIVITARSWVNTDDYWTLKFDLLEQIYIALKANNIKIPYKQLEVSFRNATKEKREEELNEKK